MKKFENNNVETTHFLRFLLIKYSLLKHNLGEWQLTTFNSEPKFFREGLSKFWEGFSFAKISKHNLFGIFNFIQEVYDNV